MSERLDGKMGCTVLANDAVAEYSQWPADWEASIASWTGFCGVSSFAGQDAIQESMISRSASEVEHLDRYATSSSAGASGIFLAASSSGAATAPFFSGRLLVPRRGADL